LRFFLTAALCRLKLSATRSLIAAMILFVTFLAFVTIAFGDRQVLVMNVGLFYPDTPFSHGLAATFESYADGSAYVKRYDDLDAMCRDVKSGRLECAYVLPESYEPNGTIALYVTADTRGDVVSSVLMASAYMQDMAGELGFRVLRHYLPGSRQEITAAVTERNQAWLSLGAFMEIEYLPRNAGFEPPSGGSLYYAQNGVTALFSLLITLLLCLGLVRERKTSIAMRLTLAGNAVIYSLANVAAIFIVNFAFFAAAAIVTGIFPPPHVVTAYAFFISALGVTLGSAVKSESLFLGLTVTAFLCTAVLGGVFVDIGGLIPSLDSLKYLFATHYFMEGLRGSNSYASLAAGGVVLIGVLCAVGKKYRTQS